MAGKSNEPPLSRLNLVPMRQQKTPSDSISTMTEMVLPNDTNPLNNLMGGRLMHLMDIVAAIAAQRHSNSLVVTASVDNVSFSHPIALGDVVTLQAKVTRAFRTSMEIHIEVAAENIPSGQKQETHSAFFTFVAVGADGKPVEVPDLVPTSEKERQLYDGALRRRQLRLILAGRLKPKDAPELKSLFFDAL